MHSPLFCAWSLVPGFHNNTQSYAKFCNLYKLIILNLLEKIDKIGT